ncbi:DUF7382 domain-containing protein [Halarchaeum nitratireducens]|uniref:DUF7382 domain-containing protein n=1 Tax=Halarchaeum nitratireducens TaxID=489913 RepID=A0A830G7R6_9EURY|nr:carboxypeptidase regulatory-like domain-containing protein [Halarchaeum nitratireducens]GGN06289.1 hypothetical protein GCM10009021_01550 [Halarchaeum nitratireducens]
MNFESVRSKTDRGVAGLPIRLVVAFVVGTAVLGVILNMVSGVGALTATELDAQPTPDVVRPGNRTVTVAAVDADGHTVPGVTVVLSGDTAGLAGGEPIVARTNANRCGDAPRDADAPADGRSRDPSAHGQAAE